MGGQIPVVDLEGDPQKLKEASEEWGTFRLLNHGVPTELMAEMKKVTRGLHDLPLEIKQRNKDGKGNGYVARSETSPFYESLGVFDAAASSSVSSFCSQLEASPHQRHIIVTYTRAIQKLAINIAGKLAKSMGASGYCFEGWTYHFWINKYSFSPETVGSPALHTHTDAGFMTIVQDDDNIGGLEVMDPSGTFVPVHPWPGTLLVNFGDIAVPWSNGRVPNVQHRAHCINASLRFSIVTFISPPPQKAIEAPSEFIDGDHPRAFAPFTYEEYWKHRMTIKNRTGGALELFRK